MAELINSPLDFLAPSGGNILNCHHLEFVPILNTPTVPSGTLWMEPNDGQLERFLYQGTSGILEVRDTEGHGAYLFFSSSSSANDFSISTTPTLLDLAGGSTTVQYEEDDFITSKIAGSPTQWAVKVSGLYKVSYNLTFSNESAGNRDGTLETQMLINGAATSGSTVQQYIAPPDAGQVIGTTLSASFLTKIGPNQRIELSVRQFDGGVNTLRMLTRGGMVFELIEPEVI